MSVFSGILRIHQAIYEKTGGVVGHRILGVPTLLLRTTGRKSGRTRTNALFYIKDAGRQIVVASNGGDPTPPAWLLNLQANPQVEVQIARHKRPATASVTQPGDADYDRLWQAANKANFGRYDAYQSRTSRPISLVALTPA